MTGRPIPQSFVGARFAGPLFGRLPPDVLRVVTASAGWLVCNCTGIHAARRRGSPVPADNLPSPARSGSATTPPSTRNTADATASRALAVGCRRTARHAGLASFSGRSVLTKRRCPVSQDRQVTPSGAPPRQASRRTLLARLLRDNPHGRKSCSIAAQWKRTYPPPTINRARQFYAEKLGMKPVAEFGGEALRYKTSSGPSSTSTRPSTPGRPVTPSPNGTSTTSTRRSGI
jgi:hypothetical protein